MPYVELQCKTNYSFLEGASHPEELVEQAAALAYGGLAVTDRNTLAGVVRAHGAAKDRAFPLIIGAEISFADAPPVLLWAIDRAGYGRLSRLITVGRRRASKGECSLRFDDLANHHSGLLAGILAEPLLPGSPSQSTSSQSAPSQSARSEHRVGDYRELFGDRCYWVCPLLRGGSDDEQLDRFQAAARAWKLPLLAAGDVHYHVPERLPLQHVLTAIRQHTTVVEAGGWRFPNAERHLRPLDDLARLYRRAPSLLERTVEVAQRCRFSLDELRYEYPEELAPSGEPLAEYLARLTWDGATRRYPQGIPDKVRRLVEYELALIRELNYEAYFLTVWDLVRFARSQGILCQGRGSAANSAVCFCLGVTAVDPDRADLLFERFISRERDEAPDIDIDFEHERREEVLQYLYDKYGRERAGMTGVVITYRSRSAIRDVGKALGFPHDQIDRLASNTEGYHHDPRLADRCREVGINPDNWRAALWISLVDQLIGFPRHLSQHVGGMVITRGPLCELAPIENAAMPGRTVIEWDKDDLDELGILKVDCLALGMLTAIRKCLGTVERQRGERWELATIPAEDPRIYEQVCRADTMGIFQIESRAQMSMLPRLKPRTFYDLVIEVAIVRPGPIQGQMVHPYLRRRAGEEAPVYPNDAIREVLHKTLGVPIFQEQAMRLAVVAAGFSPGEADQLRRAMGAWRRPGVIDRFHTKLLQGMESRGLSREFAEQIFQQIRGFGEYGFPESHAASFALLVYASAWLKCYFPAHFTAALLNSQPMGFYAPAQLIRDLREHGYAVRPVDVNHSDWDCTLEPNRDDGRDSLRLGFRLLNHFPRRAAERIMEVRQAGPFQSLDELARRTELTRATLLRLAEADTFASLAQDRRQALWSLLGQDDRARLQPLFRPLLDDEPLPDLPQLSLQENVFLDYLTAGLSLKSHPLAFYREQLKTLRVLPARELEKARPDRQVRVAGLVLLRQRPGSAKGITFVTLEDETGIANLVIKQAIWDRYHAVARHSPAWIAHGQLQSKDSVIHVVVNRLDDLSGQLESLATKSRDFR